MKALDELFTKTLPEMNQAILNKHNMKTEERKREDRQLLRKYIYSGQQLEAFIKSHDLTPVKLSHEEIEKDLISQAIQKGYVKGCKVKCFEGWHDIDGDLWMNNSVEYELERDGTLWIEGIHFHRLCIFKDGNWADFIEQDNFIDSMFGNVMSQLDDISRDLKKIKKTIK